MHAHMEQTQHTYTLHTHIAPMTHMHTHGTHVNYQEKIHTTFNLNHTNILYYFFFPDEPLHKFEERMKEKFRSERKFDEL